MIAGASLLLNPLRRLKARLRPAAPAFDIWDITSLNAELVAHHAEPLASNESDPVRKTLHDVLTRRCKASVLADASGPGEPTKRVFEIREDLREKYPFALTPHHRREYLAWLLVHGRPELALTTEGILWALLEIDAKPDRGLEATYRLMPAWQTAVPDALTPAGWPKLKRFLQDGYSIRDRWLTRATCRLVNPVDADAGVNVVGHYRYASGLQEACGGVVTALLGQGVPLKRRDLPVHHLADWRDRERYQDLEEYDTTVVVAAVNTFPREYYRRSGLRMRDGVRRIAYWYWEVDRLPAAWNAELEWADEVWAPTSFLADAFRKHVKVPVVPMLPGVTLPAFAAKPRSFFNLPEDRFTFLFSFDMGSVMERKNPLGLVAAFEKAFRKDDAVHLCIKVNRGEYHRDNLAKLKDACRRVGATLINEVLPREDALALLNSADCYASLHRAEGLGLGLAESMLLGKPVIATAYSGNLDFMTDATSYLVNATTVPIVDTPPYPPGSVWAAPEPEHAAAQLRHVYDYRDEARRAVAERGRAHVRDLLSVDAAGRRMVQRLRELRTCN